MEQSEYIAALDLGTSKMIAMTARKNNEGVLSVLTAEKVDSENCIRRGCIYNISETTAKLSQLISQLSEKNEPALKKIYLGIGGQSLRTQIHSITEEVNGIVTPEVLDSLNQKCMEYKHESVEILDVVSPEYYVDGHPDSNPAGVNCQTIEAKYQLILGRPSLKNYLTKCVEDTNTVEIAGYFISPLATATAVLSNHEKTLGCALIEFGAGITYLSVYKDNILRYLVAIPLGGNGITKDISSLNFLEKEAEELKIKYGSALSDSDDVRIPTSREKELENLANVVEARMDEILANIFNQLKLSGYENSIGAGFIITGGGASLRHLEESIRTKTGKEVRLVNTSPAKVTPNKEFTNNPAHSTVLGLLLMGTENCAKEVKAPIVEAGKTDIFGEPIPEKEEKPNSSKRKPSKSTEERKKEKGKGIFDKWKHALEGMFDDTDNNTDE